MAPFLGNFFLVLAIRFLVDTKIHTVAMTIDDVSEPKKDFCLNPCISPEDKKDDSSASIIKNYHRIFHPKISGCNACYMDGFNCDAEEEEQCRSVDDGKTRKCLEVWGLNYEAATCVCLGEKEGEYVNCNDEGRAVEMVTVKPKPKDLCNDPCPEDNDDDNSANEDKTEEISNRYQPVPHPKRKDCRACIDKNKECSKDETEKCDIYKHHAGKCVQVLGVDIKDHAPECYCMVKTGLVIPPEHQVVCHRLNESGDSNEEFPPMLIGRSLKDRGLVCLQPKCPATCKIKVGNDSCNQCDCKQERKDDEKYGLDDLFVFRTAGGKFVLLEQDKESTRNKVHLKLVQGTLFPLLSKKKIHFFSSANDLHDKTGFLLPLINKPKWPANLTNDELKKK